MLDNERDDDAVAAALSPARRISRSQVNRLRRGKSKPPLETAEALEKITGIPVLVLMKGADCAQDAANA